MCNRIFIFSTFFPSISFIYLFHSSFAFPPVAVSGTQPVRDLLAQVGARLVAEKGWPATDVQPDRLRLRTTANAHYAQTVLDPDAPVPMTLSRYTSFAVQVRARALTGRL